MNCFCLRQEVCSSVHDRTHTADVPEAAREAGCSTSKEGY